MFESLHNNKPVQLLLGLILGTGFGFLLQKGNVASYDVIIGQLLLTDFTVLKLMLSAVLVSMILLHIMKYFGWITFHIFPGSLGSSALGGCIFGIGFAVLGLCPGTLAAAIGTGQMDTLLGGAVGMVIGTGVFAYSYPIINEKFMDRGVFPAVTIPGLLQIPDWIVVVMMAVIIVGFLLMLEYLGL